MSYWEYEAGRKHRLEEMAKGDFSAHYQGADPKMVADRLRLMKWAQDELKKIEEEKLGKK